MRMESWTEWMPSRLFCLQAHRSCMPGKMQIIGMLTVGDVNSELWEKLGELLNSDKKGAAIIVTPRHVTGVQSTDSDSADRLFDHMEALLEGMLKEVRNIREHSAVDWLHRNVINQT